MNEELANEVKAVIAEKLGIDVEKVVDEARFVDDLDADSLDTVELVMGLEEHFGVEISNSEAAEIQSVKDAIAFVAEKVK